MKHKFNVISPRSLTASGKAVEVHGDRFAILRIPGIDRSAASLLSQIQEKVGLPLVVLGPEQELELCEVVET